MATQDPTRALAEYDRRVASRRVASRLGPLPARGCGCSEAGLSTAGGWDVEHVVFIGDASTNIGGCWLVTAS